MNGYEASDRRLKWERFVQETSPGSRVVSGSLSHGYFLEERLESARFSESTFQNIGIFQSRFEGGQWCAPVLNAVDFSQTLFRHVFFQSVDFRDCTFHEVLFDHCVFLGCQFPGTDAPFQGWRQVGCLSVAEESPYSQPETVVPMAAPSEPAGVPSMPAAPKPSSDRFARLER